MNRRYLLDTNIVSVPTALVPDLAVMRRLETDAERCCIASPVWHELLFGCLRLAPGRRRSALEEYLREVVRPTFPILPYDESVAVKHAEVRAQLESQGWPVPFADSPIASIALFHGLIVVTANMKDYDVFPDLSIEDWTS